MTAGYSGTPLPKKLGLKPGMRAAAVNAPKQYTKLLGLLDGVRMGTRLSSNLDFIHAFFRDATELAAAFPRLKRSLAKDGALWISWPKMSSPLAGGLREGEVRAIGLAGGLVDVKVCAVDEDQCPGTGMAVAARLRLAEDIHVALRDSMPLRIGPGSRRRDRSQCAGALRVRAAQGHRRCCRG